MFLLTLFLMDGPKEIDGRPKDSGHDNNVFTTADEMGLPSITRMVNNGKDRPRTENSRL